MYPKGFKSIAGVVGAPAYTMGGGQALAPNGTVSLFRDTAPEGLTVGGILPMYLDLFDPSHVV